VESAICALAAALAAGSVACSSSETLQGPGTLCFLVTDCKEGLACVPQADGKRRCSSDLTPIQHPAEAAAPAPASDSGPPDATSDAPAAPDVALTVPPDATTPPADAASAPPNGPPFDGPATGD
jgi:hypothetical protein